MSGGAAYAQSGIPDRVLRAEEVVVVGERDEMATIPSQKLAGEELKRLNAVSVADAIRYFSGIQVKDYGGIGGLKSVNVRSLGSQHVGVFYDGVQLGNAQNGQIDLGRFSMDNMEAVDLYNGQKSDIFQTAKDYASASAVYLQTRQPVFESGRRNNLKLSLKGGSFGTVNPAALWEHRLNALLDAQVSAEYMYTTGRYRFRYSKRNGYDMTDVRRNGDVNAARIEGGLFGRLPSGDWRAKIYFYDSERGYPGASTKDGLKELTHEDRQWDRNFFVQSSLRQSFGRYSLMLNAKYAYDYLHYLAVPDDNDPYMYTDHHFRQREAYFSAANEYAFTDKWRASLSIDYQYNTLAGETEPSDPTGFAYPSRHTFLTAAATAFDHGRFKLQGSLLHTYVRDITRVAGREASDKNRLTPTLIASWQVQDGLTLRAFYKNIFRTPTLNDNYYTLIGNTSLKPEYTTQYNLGAMWEYRWLSFRADAYYNEVRDKIVALPQSNQFRWTMLNLGYVEIRGIDIAATARYGIFRTRLSYTYQKAQDFTDKTEKYYGSQIPYAPLHSGSVILGATWKEWDINYSFVYTGERWASSDNDAGNYILPWYTSDMSVSRTLGRWRLTAEINNIFNQQYEVVRNYPMPGTNLRIKVELYLMGN